MELYRAEDRINVAHLLVDLVLAIHRSGRMQSPRRGNLGGELELILTASVVLIGQANGKPRSASDVGRILTIPRVSARRKLETLVARGILVRKGTRYRVSDTAPDDRFNFLDTAQEIINRAADSRPNWTPRVATDTQLRRKGG